MKKKTFALILVAAMAVSMTACSSAGSADASDADFNL